MPSATAALVVMLACGCPSNPPLPDVSIDVTDVGTDIVVPFDAPDAFDAAEAADITADSDAGDEMVLVPEGAFQMGCNSVTDHTCSPDEFPSHIVRLSAFEIDVTEVTIGAYAACVSAGVCTPRVSSPGDRFAAANRPVAGVTDMQAMAYCVWRGKRLPTEAEWEKAARSTDGRIYPWGNAAPSCTLANSDGCTGQSDPVGSHPMGASPYGAQDMAGNVEEWVSDWYDAMYYVSSPTIDPPGAASGAHRVRRGGTYLYITAFLRTSSRGDMDPSGQTPSLGFRCARSVGPQLDGGMMDATVDGGSACSPTSPSGSCADPYATCVAGACCPYVQACGTICCAGGRACVGGSCCPLNQACGSTCCPGGQRCEAAACAAPATPCSPTNPRGACAAGHVCINGSCCSSGSACGWECCGASEACVGGVCRPSLSICGSLSCAASQMCSGGVCVDRPSACSATNPTGACAAGYSCTSAGSCCANTCLTGGTCCATGFDCVLDHATGASSCLPQCMTSADCFGDAGTGCCVRSIGGTGNPTDRGTCRATGSFSCACLDNRECPSGACAPEIDAINGSQPFIWDVCVDNDGASYHGCNGGVTCRGTYCCVDGSGLSPGHHNLFCALPCAGAATCPVADCEYAWPIISGCPAMQMVCTP